MKKKLIAKDINLMVPFSQREQLSPEKRRAVFFGSIPVVILIIGIVVFDIFLLGVSNLEKQKDELLDFVQDPIQQDFYDRARLKQDTYADYMRIESEVKKLQEAVASYPSINERIFDNVYGQCNSVIKVNSYAFDLKTAVISFSCTAKTEQDAAKYVDRLKATMVFTNVGYYGYQKQEKGSFKFDVNCTLKAVENID